MLHHWSKFTRYINFVTDFLTWTRAQGGGVPCGPLSKHCCLVTVQERVDTPARRNYSLTSMRSKPRSDVVQTTNSALSRQEPRRSTFPQRRSEITVTSEQTAADSAAQVTSDATQNGHNIHNCVAVSSRDCVDECVSSFKRNHRVSSDERMDCETVWNSSREDLVPSSSRGFFKSLAPSCIQSAAVGSSMEIDNPVFDVKDECSTKSRTDDIFLQFIDPRIAVEKLGISGNTDKEHSSSDVSKPDPVSVELNCLTSGPELRQRINQRVLLEDLEQTTGSLPQDVVDPSSGGAYLRSQFVKEAWVSVEDEEESSLSSVDFEDVQVRQLFRIFGID